jgi:hypothetical protein
LLLLTCWYIINLPIGTNVYPILWGVLKWV